MSTTAIGRAAEEAAAKYLMERGYKLIAKNWRTRWCEIDLIMQKGGTVYFVEVKYRSSDKWGSGFDYITPKKLQQMRFSAELWMLNHLAQTQQYSLAAIELSAPYNTIATFCMDL